MAAYFLTHVVALFVFALNTGYGLQTVNGTIRITIGTTATCSDTIRFINNQLVEAYNQYRDFLDIEFVPWGRTQWNADGSMICQFGPNNCWADRLHRCALNMLRNDQAAQLRFMQCEFTSPIPGYWQGSYYCANEVGLRLVDVDNCVSRPYDDLDRAAQEAAREPIQIINFVPSISFNGQHDLQLHNQAIQRLSSVICFALADDPSTGIVGCTI